MAMHLQHQLELQIIPCVAHEFCLGCDDIARGHISDTLPNLHVLSNKECNLFYMHE